MPVIIDELVVSVEVTNPSGSSSSGGGGAVDKQAIINECVERILEILQQKKER
jgi:hypothetical protein